jgi:hypothetical protein
MEMQPAANIEKSSCHSNKKHATNFQPRKRFELFFLLIEFRVVISISLQIIRAQNYYIKNEIAMMLWY